ncbi:anti-sigma factor [Pseudonocardia sp. ICBG162]|uniref:anti-sigma factor n=1 Tax=Pseudonocardia sp. ICBG162 TaxID=2846761 RepID=UPI001CF6AA23|nr:anti-sigma factor [Pseudonocardia sp. ICBG162]
MNEQTVGWALHALEPDEEIEVVQHLEGCDECRRLAADVAETTTVLGSAVPQVEPPPSLRESILEQARQAPQVGRESDRAVPRHALRDETSSADGAAYEGSRAGDAAPRARPARSERSTGPATRPSGGAGRGPARNGWLRRPGRVLVAAAVALAVIVGGGAAFGQIQSLQAERDASLAQAQELRDVLSAIAQPGTPHAFLSAEPGAPMVAAVVVKDGQRQVMPMGLDPNETADQTYVLWGLNGDGTPRAVGTFDVRAGQSGPVSVESPDSGTYGTYAVSLERGREAPPAPTKVVAAGQVET